MLCKTISFSYFTPVECQECQMNEPLTYEPSLANAIICRLCHGTISHSFCVRMLHRGFHLSVIHSIEMMKPAPHRRPITALPCQHFQRFASRLAVLHHEHIWLGTMKSTLGLKLTQRFSVTQSQSRVPLKNLLENIHGKKIPENGKTSRDNGGKYF